MARPRIRITLIDQKGEKGCHRGHKIGDSYDFDTERGEAVSDGNARCISVRGYPAVWRRDTGTGEGHRCFRMPGCRYAECL